jgi:hypothetical protein
MKNKPKGMTTEVQEVIQAQKLSSFYIHPQEKKEDNLVLVNLEPHIVLFVSSVCCINSFSVDSFFGNHL